MRWRLLTTWDVSPELAMGLDEALLERPGTPPTLRFYTWSPAALSLGYFQRPADVPAAARAGVLVRRLTGGGAIHHARELTFSFTTDLADPLYAGPVAASYERVHAAIAAALRAFDLDAHPRGTTLPASEQSGTGMCFHRSSALDLVWDGRKGLGSAQRRRAGRVLHHGSLKLSPTDLDTGVAAIPFPPGTAPDPRLLVPALLESFERELGLRFDSADPTPTEHTEAQRRGPRYSSREWLEGAKGASQRST